ncbi:PH domain-containing protein [Aquabacterium sp.]|uniref:PH domain-containing protein n=1 Tax=Aquabacterium sp. TaxID=1872578 RepID=UPI002C8E5619|nr:PH domain-containing protein [Aquabacterium sp.]HSW07934.1 PH domain-containing protein [Aquabacterium sp.]
MFKKFASEALGLSDIGVIVPPSEFNKVDADDYLFSEDGEKIFFLIKSKKDEYCFTNFGLIHVDGDSAISSKRSIKRYDYATHRFSNVMIETAGTIDMDVELKFTVGDSLPFSIDVRKNFIEQLKDIYKALITIGKMQHRDAQAREHALQCLGVIGSMYKVNSVPTDESITQNYNTLLNAVNTTVLDRFHRRDFSAVFERYIHA